MNFIFDRIKASYKKKLPFTAYRKPESDTIAAFFQKNDTLFYTDDFSEQGFIFALFDHQHRSILIPKDESEYLEETICADAGFLTGNDASLQPETIANTSKERHIKLVKKTIEEIDKNVFKKVVVSRQEIVKTNDFDLTHTFQKLLSTYPAAMVYVWFHPKVGLWFGASPETLLNINEDKFSTMSLAGTQIYTGTEEVTWQKKEIEEQQLVTEFIKTQLLRISSEPEVNPTKTIKAGNLLHLQTKISGKLGIQGPNINTLLKALHPTPAVCGLPRDAAKEFILQNENYNRSFYTGFLGELNERNSMLFVNLRCMEIKGGHAVLFIGGGITKDSDPEKEWEETVQKSKVMKKVL